jgi:hypothetical protein
LKDASGRERLRDRFGRPVRNPRLAFPHESVPPDATPEDAFRIGRRRFDERRFFEAHEAFEHVWTSSEIGNPERPFWRAVTQVSVGMCHVQRGNVPGAIRVLGRAGDVLERAPVGTLARRVGVDGPALAALARAAIRRLRSGTPPDRFAFPRWPVARTRS